MQNMMCKRDATKEEKNTDNLRKDGQMRIC